MKGLGMTGYEALVIKTLIEFPPSDNPEAAIEAVDKVMGWVTPMSKHFVEDLEARHLVEQKRTPRGEGDSQSKELWWWARGTEKI